MKSNTRYFHASYNIATCIYNKQVIYTHSQLWKKNMIWQKRNFDTCWFARHKISIKKIKKKQIMLSKLGVVVWQNGWHGYTVCPHLPHYVYCNKTSSERNSFCRGGIINFHELTVFNCSIILIVRSFQPSRGFLLR